MILKNPRRYSALCVKPYRRYILNYKICFVIEGKCYKDTDQSVIPHVAAERMALLYATAAPSGIVKAGNRNPARFGIVVARRRLGSGVARPVS